MFGFHWPELIILLVVAVAIFGPRRLPELGSMLGRSIRDVRKGIHDLEHETGIDEVREIGKKQIADLHEVSDAVTSQSPREAPIDRDITG